MPSPRVENVSDVFVSDKCESSPPTGAAAAAANTPPLPSTGGLTYKKAWEIEDEKSGLTDNKRTMREFRAIAGTLPHRWWLTAWSDPY